VQFTAEDDDADWLVGWRDAWAQQAATRHAQQAMRAADAAQTERTRQLEAVEAVAPSQRRPQRPRRSLLLRRTI
jgi:hypothetical protein